MYRTRKSKSWGKIMQQVLNDGMKTIGIFMAVDSDHSSDEGTAISQHDVPLSFCLTADGENNTFIVTPEIAELFGMGYAAIAVLRFDPNLPDRFFQFTLEGLSERLLSALTEKSEGLVHNALSQFGRGYN
jgi:hypothetical protein